MLYGRPVWDPLLIIAQIISIQCLFYLGLGLWQTIFFGPYVGNLNVQHIFGWKHMSFHSYLGWMTMAANVINAPLGAVYLLWIVERAKKCLDYASTCYLIHFTCCCVSSGFPTSVEWWLTNLLGLAIMSLLGEWLCARRETQPIPIGSAARQRQGPASPGPGSTQMSTVVVHSSGEGRGSMQRVDSKARLLADP